ncbi:MAG: hypothetical protein R6U03_11990 [Gillisia sp.]
MKLDFILVTAILVVLIFLPFVLLPLLRNGDRKKLTKKFREEEKNHNLNTQVKENWSQNYIGLDLSEKKLLFVQKSEENFIVEIINLKLVAACMPIIEEPEVQKEGKTGRLLRRVILEFSFKNSRFKKSITLFDYDIHFSQDLEKNHAGKWADLINQQLSMQSALKRTA